QLNSNTHIWMGENLMLYERSDGTLNFSEFKIPIDLDSLTQITTLQTLKIAAYKKATEELVHFDMFDLSKETWYMPVESNRDLVLTDNCIFEIHEYGDPQITVKVKCKDGFQSEYSLPVDVKFLNFTRIVTSPLDQI